MKIYANLKQKKRLNAKLLSSLKLALDHLFLEMRAKMFPDFFFF